MSCSSYCCNLNLINYDICYRGYWINNRHSYCRNCFLPCRNADKRRTEELGYHCTLLSLLCLNKSAWAIWLLFTFIVIILDLRWTFWLFYEIIVFGIINGIFNSNFGVFACDIIYLAFYISFELHYVEWNLYINYL